MSMSQSADEPGTRGMVLYATSTPSPSPTKSTSASASLAYLSNPRVSPRQRGRAACNARTHQSCWTSAACAPELIAFL